MAAAGELEGGCSCGAVRYRLTAKPLIAHCCHCRDCQRTTGSAFVVNLWIEREHVKLLSGEPKSTLDDPAQVAPDVHIFTRSKLPWVKLPEGARAFESFYNPAEVWPAESLARWRKNMERRGEQ